MPECVLFYCMIWLFPPLSLQIISSLENKLLLAGFTETQVLQLTGVSYINCYLPLSSPFIIFVLFCCVWSVVQHNTIEICQTSWIIGWHVYLKNLVYWYLTTITLKLIFFIFTPINNYNYIFFSFKSSFPLVPCDSFVWLLADEWNMGLNYQKLVFSH